MVASEFLEEPLLSSSGPGISGPRILDRDGTFSQSRGRWSVSNTVSRSQATGSTRQRRPIAASATSSANVTTPTAAATVGGGTVPYGVASSLPRRPPSPPPSFWDRLCCRYNGITCCNGDGHSALTPRRCWDDWFRKCFFMSF